MAVIRSLNELEWHILLYPIIQSILRIITDGRMPPLKMNGTVELQLYIKKESIAMQRNVPVQILRSVTGHNSHRHITDSTIGNLKASIKASMILFSSVNKNRKENVDSNRLGVENDRRR